MSKVCLNIYGCGGTGINITRKVEMFEGTVGYPNVKRIYFDTSDRNTDGCDKENTFLLAGMNGAGKLQRTAYENAQPQINDLLQAHKPGTMNIVVFGSAGGSGSILGQMVLTELIKRDIPAVALIIGNTTSEKETLNTAATLRSLRHQSTNGIKKPISIVYLENSNSKRVSSSISGNRIEVDNKAFCIIRELALLTSEQHLELDRSDIFNWLRYDLSTDVPPQLTDLVISSDLNRLDAYHGNVISTAVLLNSPDVDVPSLNQLYSAVGYVSPELSDSLGDRQLNLICVITPATRDSRIKQLDEMADEFKEVTKSIGNFSIPDDSDASTEDGFLIA